MGQCSQRRPERQTNKSNVICIVLQAYVTGDIECYIMRRSACDGRRGAHLCAWGVALDARPEDRLPGTGVLFRNIFNNK